MVQLDFTPFYRSTIGFDRMARLLENAARGVEADIGYPAFNIESVGEDRYRVTIAVAGFEQDDLSVEVREGVLHVAGRKKDDADEHKFLHQGLVSRTFDRQFRLADHVKVEEASLHNGLLTIDLVREIPEAMKPRTIPIETGALKSLTEKAKTLLSGEKKKAA